MVKLPLQYGYYQQLLDKNLLFEQDFPPLSQFQVIFYTK